MAIETQVRLVKAWERGLREQGTLVLAEKLRDAVTDPRTASAEQCWIVIWNKPLYANTKVAIGERYQLKLEPFMTGAWRTIGLDPAFLKISRIGRGSSNDAFSVAGSLAQQCRIAARRLYAIQGAAQYLRKSVQDFGEVTPLAHLASSDLALLVPQLKEQLGRGWGPITILHMLTEFGLAVKPDLHLVRAVQALNLMPELKPDKVPGEADALKINVAVKELARAVFGQQSGPAELRYLDKVLMEASRQGLLATRAAG